MASVAFTIAASRFLNVGNFVSWANIGGTIPASYAVGNDDLTLNSLSVNSSGQVTMAMTGALSAAVRANGSLSFSGGGISFSLDFSDGSATGDNFRWQGQTALYATLDAEASASLGGTLTLDDGAGADTTAPTLLTAATNAAGTEVILTFNEALDENSVPAVSAFTLSPAKTISGVAVSGRAVTLTVTPAYANGDVAVVFYDAPATNPLQDAAGNDVADIGGTAGIAVTNNVPAPGGTTTDTDTIYIRGTTAPGAPAGGTNSENHLPSGWSRTDPGATATEDVYSAERTRTYTNGSFTSATAWGGVTLVASRTGVPLAVPGAVRNLAESATTQTSITWGWDAPNTGGAVARYEYRTAAGSAAFSGNWTSTGTTRSATLSGLSANTTHRIQVRAVNATGAGTETADSATTAAPSATSDVDSIFIRGGSTAPATPAGGTGSETHLPAGWSRTNPSATATQSVWRSERTRSYLGGAFQSATAWSAPVLFAGTTGSGALTSLRWYDGAPPLTDGASKLWRSARAVPGAPGTGDAPTDDWGDWSEPVVVGELGRGVEYIFARTADPNLPVGLRPSNTWGFDVGGTQTTGSGSSAVSVTWTDAAPEITADFPYLWRAEREVIGIPAVGTAVRANWTAPTIIGRWGADGPEGPPGVDGADGQDGQPGAGGEAFEIIFARTATATAPSAPSNSWGYDRPQSPWFDDAPGLSASNPYLWRSSRPISGSPSAGDAVSGTWRTPVVVGHFGTDGVAGADGTDGIPGADGAGIEFIFAVTATTSVPSAPSNSWGFDTPGRTPAQVQAGTGSASSVWFDGAPTTSATTPYLWMCQRRTEGFPSVGDAVSAIWSTPRIVSRFGPKGDKGDPGDPAPRIWTFEHGTLISVTRTTTEVAGVNPNSYDALHFVGYETLGSKKLFSGCTVATSAIPTGTTPSTDVLIAFPDFGDDVSVLRISKSGTSIYLASEVSEDNMFITEIWGLHQPGGATTTPPTNTLSAAISGETSRALSETASYTVSVSGGSGTISYQWQRRSGTSGSWSDVSTASSYSTSRSTAGTYQVRCVVTRGTESVTTNIVTTVWSDLPLPVAPTVTIGAVGNVNEGASQNFSATISGGTYDGTPTYRWTANGGTFSDSIGPSARWNAPLVAANTNYTITCTVTVVGTGTIARDGAQATGTDTEIVTVVNVANLDVTISADDTSPEAGDTVTLTASVTGGSGTIAYQWQQFVNGLWINIGTAATRAVSHNSAGTTSYRCIVTRNNISATSSAYSLTWSAGTTTLTASVSVDDATPTNGDTVTFTASVGGTATGTIAYQWQQLSGSSWGNISGETGSTYDHTRSTAGTVTVRCVVTRGGQTATSASASATWSASTTSTYSIALPASTPEDGFFVTINGSFPDGSTFNIRSAGTIWFTRSFVDPGDPVVVTESVLGNSPAGSSEYIEIRRVLGTNSYGPVVRSATFTLSGTAPPPTVTLTVSVSVDDASPTNGDTVTFTATVGGTATGTIGYQWQSLSGSTWSNISGETGSTYDHTRSTAGTVTVRCVVTRGGQSATSASATATWTAAPPTATPPAIDVVGALGNNSFWARMNGDVRSDAYSVEYEVSTSSSFSSSSLYYNNGSGTLSGGNTWWFLSSTTFNPGGSAGTFYCRMRLRTATNGGGTPGPWSATRSMVFSDSARDGTAEPSDAERAAEKAWREWQEQNGQ